MKKIRITGLLILFTVSCGYLTAQNSGITKVLNEERAAFQSIDLGKTQWTSGFMKNIWDRTAEETIPYLWQRYNNVNQAGYALNFERTAAGMSGGYKNGGTPFTDGDFYKWVEAVSYILAINPETEWKAILDKVIDNITAAQNRAVQDYGEEWDGYISTMDQLAGTKNVDPGKVYNFGHLMTAAAIYTRATGDTTLLHAGVRTGQFLWNYMQDFLNQQWNYWDHTTIMGAMELYRETGKDNLFNMAEWIIDNKGNFGNAMAYQYNTQINGLLIKQTTAVGHAQRANCLYAGAIDAYIEGAKNGYLTMGERMFEDITTKKMYITGGTGAIHGFSQQCDGWDPPQDNPPWEPEHQACKKHVSEGYGPAYFLPNESAYNETCAQVSMALFCWRMLQATGEVKYADLLELELFNSILSGASLDGKKFFYTNKLERLTNKMYPMDAKTRSGSSGWETSSNAYTANWAQCCPPNYARFMTMTPNMAYGINDLNKEVWINLYGSNSIQTTFADGTPVEIEQSAEEFPWQGDVKLTIKKAGDYTIKFRVPTWSKNTSVSLNGGTPNREVEPGTYHAIMEETWEVGTTIEIKLDLSVDVIPGNPLTYPDGMSEAGMVAVKRGPIVYCAERVDNPKSKTGFEFNDFVFIDSTKDFSLEYNNQLNVWALINENTYLIPYYAWDNRSDNFMRVWMDQWGTGSLAEQNESETIRLSCYPNPFTKLLNIDICSQEQQLLTVEIYDMLGNLVKRIDKDDADASSRIFTWDATNNSGQNLSPGIYVVLLKHNKNEKVLLYKQIVLKK